MECAEALLQEILENRNDDAPRRVFADWMQERGDPVQVARGEFIHVQLDRQSLPRKSERYLALMERERELLDRFGAAWALPFVRLGCHSWEYRRGFIEGIGLAASDFVASVPDLFGMTPICELKLYQSRSVLRNVCQLDQLSRLTTLDLENNGLEDEHCEMLSGSLHLQNVRTLLLWSNRIGDEGVSHLFASDLPSLSRLDLSGNLIGDEGASRIAQSARLSQLKLLDLTNNQISDAGALALANSPFLERIEWLDLSKNSIGTTGQNALRERLPGRVQVCS